MPGRAGKVTFGIFSQIFLFSWNRAALFFWPRLHKKHRLCSPEGVAVNLAFTYFYTYTKFWAEEVHT